jgi:outer membrane protein assembly factor BamB
MKFSISSVGCSKPSRANTSFLSWAFIVLARGFCVGMLCNSMLAGNWPAYRADINRSAIGQSALDSTLSLEWVFHPDQPPIPAWPMPGEETPRMHTDRAFHVVVSDQTAIFGSSVDHLLRAVDTHTGELRWRFFADGPIRFAPYIDGDRVYFGADDGYVYCLRLQDGSLVWRYRPSPADEYVIGNSRMVSLWPVRTGLIVDQGIVYVGAGVFPYEGLYICAVDANSGKEIWKNDTAGDLAWGLQYGGMAPQGYLLASDSTLYVPSGRGMPAAFDRLDGHFIRFLSQGGKTGGSWALLDQGKLIAGVNSQGNPAKVVFDDQTGKRQGDLFAQYPGIDLVMTDSMAYTVIEGGIVAIDRQVHQSAIAESAKIAKEEKTLNDQLREARKKYDALKVRQTELETLKTIESEKEYSENTLAIQAGQSQQVHLSGQLAALSSQKKSLIGKPVKWRFQKPGLGVIAMSGDTLVVGGLDFMITLDRHTGKVGSEHKVNGLLLGIAIANGRAFASTDEGKVYCFSEDFPGAPRVIKEERVTHPYGDDAIQSTYKAAAASILKESGVQKGWCLVMDGGEGRLAYELASQSQLNILAIEPDPNKVRVAREHLLHAGLYGSRVTIASWQYGGLPDYFANLVVSDGLIRGEPLRAPVEEILRVLRPAGGVLMLGHPEADRSLPVSDWSKWAGNHPLPPKKSVHADGNWMQFVRGKLEGAGSWNGLYGNAANTGSSPDQLVKDPLGVLWYGEPGSEHMLERHARSVSPLAVNGRLYVQGMEVVMGYDAYNGTQLWEKTILGAVRARADVDGSNIFANEAFLFVAAHDKTYQLDGLTGETVHEFKVPSNSDDSQRRWGFLAVEGDILFGSGAPALVADYGVVWKEMVDGDQWKPDGEIPTKIREFPGRGNKKVVQYFKEKFPTPNKLAYDEFKRDGYHWRYIAKYPSWAPDHQPSPVSDTMMISDSVFAYDIRSGQLLWEHQGARIPQISMAIGEGKLFLVKSDLNETEKNQALEDRLRMIQNGVYSQHEEENLPIKDRDLRRIVAIDFRTGEELWSRPMDMSGNGGTKMGMAYQDGRIVFFGHYSNHDQNAFVAGNLQWRRVTVLNAGNGETYWSKPLNYRRRPLIMGDTIVIEPRACSLTTGEIKTRQHPITGEEVEWEFLRPGHSCGVVTASPNSLFFRSFSAAIVNMDQDAGLELFGGTRPGCWNSMIPANGLLTLQESSAGCTCSYSLRTTVVMKTKEQKGQGEWSVFISNSPTKPVAHLALNLGAPGDMRSQDGIMWFGYPRPDTSDGQGPFKDYGVKFDLNQNPEAKVKRQDFRGITIEGSDQPWLFTSSLNDLRTLQIPLLDDGSEPGMYTVRMGFLVEEHSTDEEGLFDILLQGNTVERNVNVRVESGKADYAVMKEYSGIKVETDLNIRFMLPSPNGEKSIGTRVQCLEIIREDQPMQRPLELNPFN